MLVASITIRASQASNSLKPFGKAAGCDLLIFILLLPCHFSTGEKVLDNQWFSSLYWCSRGAFIRVFGANFAGSV